MKFLILLFLVACFKTPPLPPLPTPIVTVTPVIESGIQVIDGQGKTVLGPLEVIDKKNVLIKNFNIVGFRGKGDPAGIRILRSQNVTVDNVSVSKIESQDQAHCILVENSQGVKILNSKFFEMKIGSSECLSMHGEDFLIEGNEIYNINNIGIDVMGCESGRGPGRNGIIRNNFVHHIGYTAEYKTRKSPAGIYIDCGIGILIEGNTVSDSIVGIEVGSEHEKPSENIRVINNKMLNNQKIGLKLNSGQTTKNLVKSGNVMTGNGEADLLDEKGD